MRYLLLSDVHSNLEALYACLELAAGKYDQAVCLGDLVGYGPNPNEVIDKIRNLCKVVIRGNHDKACCGIDDAAEFNPYARMATQWTQEALASPGAGAPSDGENRVPVAGRTNGTTWRVPWRRNVLFPPIVPIVPAMPLP